MRMTGYGGSLSRAIGNGDGFHPLDASGCRGLMLRRKVYSGRRVVVSGYGGSFSRTRV